MNFDNLSDADKIALIETAMKMVGLWNNRRFYDADKGSFDKVAVDVIEYARTIAKNL